MQPIYNNGNTVKEIPNNQEQSTLVTPTMITGITVVCQTIIVSLLPQFSHTTKTIAQPIYVDGNTIKGIPNNQEQTTLLTPTMVI